MRSNVEATRAAIALWSLIALGACAHDSPKDTAEPQCANSGAWVGVAAGYESTCGVHQDGCAECWPVMSEYPPKDRSETGFPGYTGETIAPATPFRSVALHRCPMWQRHACGIRLDDGGVECWGSDAWGASSPPEGEWTQVTLGHRFSCALGADGRVACWGDTGAGRRSTVYTAASDYVDISACYVFACALASDGRTDCWEEGFENQLDTTTGPWTAMDSDWFGGPYGITPDGGVAGWEDPDPYPPPPPPGPAVDLCLGGESLEGCYLLADGHVSCFGHDLMFSADDPAASATFTAIACGSAHACGVTTEGDLLCWGLTCDRGDPECDVPVH